MTGTRRVVLSGITGSPARGASEAAAAPSASTMMAETPPGEELVTHSGMPASLAG